jgi:catalase
MSGSDKRIHGFEADDDNLTFVEVSTKIYFPELSQKFPDVVTRMLIQPVNEITRSVGGGDYCSLYSSAISIRNVALAYNS